MEERWGDPIDPPVQVSAKAVLDSVSPAGKRITTLQLRYPRFIHSEFLTHRAFSRSASSSRAIPASKLIDAVYTAPACPVSWGKNEKGMQATQELEVEIAEAAAREWHLARLSALRHAEELNALGCHKQIVNRILEPFSHISVVVTSTEWENFFTLRRHRDADPTMQALARVMWHEMAASFPVERDVHLPYLTPSDYEMLALTPEALFRVSAARCARVSYLLHDNSQPVLEKDVALANDLLQSRHMSPFEHQATALNSPTARSANFLGWQQYRTLVEASFADASVL